MFADNFDNKPDKGSVEQRYSSEQPGLRGIILLTTIAVVSLGGLLFCTGSAGHMDLVPLELLRTADLLKVPANLSDDNMLRVFKVLAAIGYGTVNIGAVAICAVSGRRRVHAVTGAALSGAAAIAFIAALMAVVKPRIAEITKAMQSNLKRYFRAFELTGDERYVSQIHLHSGCCGLSKGAGDFRAWGRNLPSSCCGQLSGNCSTTNAWKLTCQQAVDKLAGFDGLLGHGYVVCLLGVACAALSALLMVLLFSGVPNDAELLAEKDEAKDFMDGPTGHDKGLQKMLDHHGDELKPVSSLGLGKKQHSDFRDSNYLDEMPDKDRTAGWKTWLGLGKIQNDNSSATGNASLAKGELPCKSDREVKQQDSRMQNLYGRGFTPAAESPSDAERAALNKKPR